MSKDKVIVNLQGFYQRSEDTYRREDDAVTVMMLHFSDGWRWWVYNRRTSADIGDPNGYALLDEALEVARNYKPRSGNGKNGPDNCQKFYDRETGAGAWVTKTHLIVLDGTDIAGVRLS